VKHPFKARQPQFKMDTMDAALKDSLKKPYIGVTQGGSSRKNGGARVAAVVSKVKQPKEN
jgi:hypothetical protein